MQDLNARDVEQAMLVIAGTARSMGVEVEVMAQHGKRYREARGAIDREQIYTPVEAVRLLKDAPAAKFDETVEVHMNLGLNVRHADEQLRGTMMLPHGTGREQRVAVFAEGDKAREAEEAGADVVGSADLAKRIEEGFTDFDVAIATPGPDGQRRPARPRARPARPDAEPEDGHRHVRRGEGRHATRRPASSSTAPTAARTCTSRSASGPSTSARWSRTTPR